MTMIKLQATDQHPTYKAGTVYEVAPIFAASDLYMKRAMEISQDQPLTAPDAIAVSEPDTIKNETPEEAKRRKQLEGLARARSARQYNRRDMKAQ